MNRSIPLTERWLRIQPDWVHVIIGVDVFFFILSLLATHFLGQSDGSPLTPSHEALFFIGSNAPAQILDGQVQRLLMATWLHANLLHLLCNLYALWSLGPAARHLLGAHSFVSLYGFSALFASLVSAARHALPVILGNENWQSDLLLYQLPGGVGASGALFGVFGFIFMAARKTPGAKALANQLKFWLVVNLVIGFTVPVIDNAAHIGGFIAGMIFAQVWFRNPRPGARGFLLGPRASAFFIALYLLAFGAAGWMVLGPPGQQARAYLEVRPAVLNAIDGDLHAKDIEDSIRDLDETATRSDLIDIDALKGYMRLRLSFSGRRPSVFEVPVEAQAEILRWNEFTRAYIRALGPLAMVSFRRS